MMTRVHARRWRAFLLFLLTETRNPKPTEARRRLLGPVLHCRGLLCSSGATGLAMRRSLRS